MVNDQINWVQRVNLLWITAEGLNPVAHRRKVNNRWNTCKVLHQNAGRAIGNLAWVLATFGTPLGEGFDVVDGNRLAIFKAQHVFQYDLQCSRKLGEITKTGFCRGWDGIIGDGRVTDLKGLTRFAGVLTDCDGHESLLI